MSQSLGGRHRKPSRPGRWTARGPRAAFVLTACSNVLMMALSSSAGLLIARELGPAVRGQYAGVVVWFGLALIIGEVGQSAALCYFVASDSSNARHYVSTARGLMITTGSLAIAAGWLLSSHLGRGNAEVALSYRTMFSTCLLSFVGASFVFSLQATNIRLWNMVRLVQPIIYLLGVCGLIVVKQLSLVNVVLTLAGSILSQTVIAACVCYRVGLLGGRFRREFAGPLAGYGASQVLASTPTVLNARLDQLMLSTMTTFGSLGIYAVAVSITSVAGPIVSSLGNVLFPRIAAQKAHGTAELEKRAVWWSLFIGVAMMAAVAMVSPWVIPVLFGTSYSPAVRIVWILCAGSVFLGSGQVIGDLLRGRGNPLLVAAGQGVGAVATVCLLLLLLPRFGIEGAAVASSAAYAFTFVLLAVALRWSQRRELQRPAEQLQSVGGGR